MIIHRAAPYVIFSFAQFSVELSKRQIIFSYRVEKILARFLFDISGRKSYNIKAGRNALYTRGIELTFKRHVRAPTTGTASGRFFVIARKKEV